MKALKLFINNIIFCLVEGLAISLPLLSSYNIVRSYVNYLPFLTYKSVIIIYIFSQIVMYSINTTGLTSSLFIQQMKYSSLNNDGRFSNFTISLYNCITKLFMVVLLSLLIIVVDKIIR